MLSRISHFHRHSALKRRALIDNKFLSTLTKYFKPIFDAFKISRCSLLFVWRMEQTVNRQQRQQKSVSS